MSSTSKDEAGVPLDKTACSGFSSSGCCFLFNNAAVVVVSVIFIKGFVVINLIL